MTTIAANRKEMAADRKVVDGDTCYRTAKIQRIGQAVVGAAGENPTIAKFMNWLEKENRRRKGSKPLPPPVLRESEAEDVPPFAALVLTPSGLYVYDIGCHPDEVTDPFYAIGTGKQAALAAMHLGASPTQAVEIACRVDNYSGEPIDCLKMSD